MTLNLDPGTFGRTPACQILVEKLNAHGDENLAASVSRVLAHYFTGLRDLIRVSYKTRYTIMKMWRDRYLVYGQQQLKHRFDGDYKAILDRLIDIDRRRDYDALEPEDEFGF